MCEWHVGICVLEGCIVWKNLGCWHFWRPEASGTNAVDVDQGCTGPCNNHIDFLIILTLRHHITAMTAHCLHQISTLRAELLAMRAERDALQQRLHDSDAAASSLEAEVAAQSEAMTNRLRDVERELAQSIAMHQRGRRDKVGGGCRQVGWGPMSGLMHGSYKGRWTALMLTGAASCWIFGRLLSLAPPLSKSHLRVMDAAG